MYSLTLLHQPSLSRSLSLFKCDCAIGTPPPTTPLPAARESLRSPGDGEMLQPPSGLCLLFPLSLFFPPPPLRHLRTQTFCDLRILAAGGNGRDGPAPRVLAARAPVGSRAELEAARESTANAFAAAETGDGQGAVVLKPLSGRRRRYRYRSRPAWVEPARGLRRRRGVPCERRTRL